ncbi:hypothetical protein [Pseudonocardia zijingensis]|uniref:Uncharacterized protein n=1 Tax=Pseudonocardia zijingensis TaxID=153376 RepID=A0ABN1NB43_9PSEU
MMSLATKTAGMTDVMPDRRRQGGCITPTPRDPARITVAGVDNEKLMETVFVIYSPLKRCNGP